MGHLPRHVGSHRLARRRCGRSPRPRARPAARIRGGADPERPTTNSDLLQTSAIAVSSPTTVTERRSASADRRVRGSTMWCTCCSPRSTTVRASTTSTQRGRSGAARRSARRPRRDSRPRSSTRRGQGRRRGAITSPPASTSAASPASASSCGAQRTARPLPMPPRSIGSCRRAPRVARRRSGASRYVTRRLRRWGDCAGASGSLSDRDSKASERS